MGPVYHDKLRRTAGDVIAVATDDRNEGRRLHANLGEERPGIRPRCARKVGLIVPDQIHLVDEDGELADAEHRHHVAVAP